MENLCLKQVNIYFSHNARDFKKFDFEAESDMPGKCLGAFLC